MKNRDLANSLEGLQAISSIKALPLNIAFAIGLNINAVKDHMEVFNDLKKKVLEEHAKKDKDGTIIPFYHKTQDGKFVIDEETGKPAFTQGSMQFGERQKEVDAAFKELLDTEIDDKVVLRVIKLSKLRDKSGALLTGIEPQHLAACMWMFEDDLSGDDAVVPAKVVAKKTA